jgi:hypothetical protein
MFALSTETVLEGMFTSRFEENDIATMIGIV